MSGNWYDIEKPSTHFRRRLSRFMKKLRGGKLTLDDISVMQVCDKHGTSYEARRSINNGWTVYRIYFSMYGKKKRISYEKIRDVDTAQQAVDILNGICPVEQMKNTGEYNHPIQIARLLEPD